MEDLLLELEEKYNVKMQTMRELIDTTDSESEPHEIAKYKAVYRFIKNFSDDLRDIKDCFKNYEG